MRSDETAAKLESVKKLAATDPATILLSAAAMDPGGVALADKIGDMMAEHIRGGTSKCAAATVTIVIASIACNQGWNFKTNVEGAGEALDHHIDALVSTLRFAAERGFAQARKERDK